MEKVKVSLEAAWNSIAHQSNVLSTLLPLVVVAACLTLIISL